MAIVAWPSISETILGFTFFVRRSVAHVCRRSWKRGPTEDERRAERRAGIERAVETEQELRWGRLSVGIAEGIFGRSPDTH